ncbi:MAG: hypothetical protein VKQ33_12475 [Candidatus Sericytochromatia bacterium]|nr:hypothetical protein [Candidatus Sericytochromatia bacterium]
MTIRLRRCGRLLVGLGLALATATGCEVPLVPTELEALVGGSQAGRIAPLGAGSSVLAQLGPRRGAILAVGSSSAKPDQLALRAEPDTLAWRASPFRPPGGSPDLTIRLRAWEAPLRARPPRLAGRRLLEAPGVQVGDVRPFWVVQTTDGTQAIEVKIEARCVELGTHCHVWLDTRLAADELRDRVHDMVVAFDGAIYPTTTRLFGQPVAEGVDGEPRVALLVSPAVGNYGDDTTLGYFALRDLFPPDASPGALPELARSNHRLMLYLSPLVVGHGRPTDYLGTVAHELQHLIGASRRVFAAGGPRQPEAVWLDEVLSMVAMAANGYGMNTDSTVLFNHVRGFLASPHDYSLTEWDLNPDTSAYGAAYLFGTYIVERFGEGLLKELVEGPEVGRENVEARLGARGETFEGLFRDWMLATLLDETGISKDPRHQYTTLALIGGRGGRRLRGVRLEPMPAPGRASLQLKPTSMRFLALTRVAGGSFRLGFEALETREAFLVLP